MKRMDQINIENIDTEDIEDMKKIKKDKIRIIATVVVIILFLIFSLIAGYIGLRKTELVKGYEKGALEDFVKDVYTDKINEQIGANSNLSFDEISSTIAAIISNELSKTNMFTTPQVKEMEVIIDDRINAAGPSTEPNPQVVKEITTLIEKQYETNVIDITELHEQLTILLRASEDISLERYKELKAADDEIKKWLKIALEGLDSNIRKTNEELTRKTESLTKQNEELQKKIKELEELLKNTSNGQTGSNVDIENITNQLTSITSQLNNINTTITNNTTVQNTVNKSMDNAKAIQDINTKINKLNVDINTLRNSINANKSKTDKDIKDLQDADNAIADEIEKLQKKDSSLDTDIYNLKNANDAFNKQIIELEKRVGILEEKIASLDTINANVSKALTSIEAVRNYLNVKEYAQGNTYSKGDIVVFNNKFYRSSADNNTATPEDASKWSETTISDQLEGYSTTEEVQQRIDEANQAIIEKLNYSQYNNSAKYTNGVTIIYNGKLYISKQGNNTGHTPDTNPEYWQQTEVSKLIDQSNERIDKLIIDMGTLSQELKNELQKKADKNEVETKLGDKANKSEVKTELDKKANTSEVDEKLKNKANTSDVDDKLKNKANTSDVDEKLKEKADDSKIGDFGDKTVKNYVDDKLGEKIDSSTIGDLGSEPDVVTYVTNVVNGAVNNINDTINNLTERIKALENKKEKYEYRLDTDTGKNILYITEMY